MPETLRPESVLFKTGSGLGVVGSDAVVLSKSPLDVDDLNKKGQQSGFGPSTLETLKYDLSEDTGGRIPVLVSPGTADC